MAKLFQMHSRVKPSESTSCHASEFVGPALAVSRCGVAAVAVFFFFSLSATVCHAQIRDVVCRDGAGDFDAEFQTGVAVRVGPSRAGLLEARVCEAVIHWGDQSLVVA